MAMRARVLAAAAAHTGKCSRAVATGTAVVSPPGTPIQTPGGSTSPRPTEVPTPGAQPEIPRMPPGIDAPEDVPTAPLPDLYPPSPEMPEQSPPRPEMPGYPAPSY